MQIKFKHIHIENFCGIYKEPLDTDLYDRTVIKGRNAVGKSTIRNAIFWVLYSKLSDGSTPDGIRPHDENGIDYDGLVTMSQLTVSSDGSENTLRKEFFQKKNRQGKYTGENDTVYYIDDVKKGTKKAYDEFVSTLIPNEVCINANMLLKKDTSGRREILKVFEKHTDEDVIAENPKFEELRGKLKANSVADLKKTCREKINGTKKKEYKDGFECELKRIGIEIDVQESKKKDIDVAELELQRNAILEQIEDIEAKESDISKQYEEYQKLSDGIMELQFKLNDLQRKANESLEKQRGDIGSEQWDKQKELGKIEQQIKLNRQDIEHAEKAIERNTILLNATRDNWTSANERVFDENSLVCSYCGQEYPAEKKEQLRAEFDAHRKEELADITVRGNELKAAIDKDKAEIEQLKTTLTENERLKIELETQIAELETRYKELPQSIDISDTEEYKSIQSQIAEKEAAMQQGNSADEIRQKLREQKAELQSQLVEVNTQIAIAEENVKIDEKIGELQKKRREVSQQIADVDRELDLLKEFERKKAELFEKDVNENFEFAQVKMFDRFQNGEIKDICEFVHKGTSYDGNLNHGARILTEIDICRAFQKLYGIVAPIIIEDTESVDDERIPQVENQLIMLKRTDNEKLTIEEAR